MAGWVRKDLSEEGGDIELRPGREGSTSHANSGPGPEGTADAKA